MSSFLLSHLTEQLPNEYIVTAANTLRMKGKLETWIYLTSWYVFSLANATECLFEIAGNSYFPLALEKLSSEET